MNKIQAHQTYRLQDGTIVPSTTTILQLINKPALIVWANKLGLQGIDVQKYTDMTAEAGTIAHKLILSYFTKEQVDLTDYSKDVIEKAENSFFSFLEWTKGKTIEPILIEHSAVSEKYKYGGTLDFYGKINGILTLVDFKTGSNIYQEYFYQLAAYKHLLFEENRDVERVMIVRIPRTRTEDEVFETKEKKSVEKEWLIFQCLLDIYYLKKELEEDI